MDYAYSQHPDILNLEYYTKNNIGNDKEMRLRWDIFYVGRRYFGEEGLQIISTLYKYCNDNHVDSVLKLWMRKPMK